MVAESSEYMPAPQVAQNDRLTCMYLPDSQSVHESCEAPIAPALPSAQPMHEDWSGVAYWPAEHAVHAEVLDEYWPGSHATHGSMPEVAETKPAPHAVHACVVLLAPLPAPQNVAQ